MLAAAGIADEVVLIPFNVTLVNFAVPDDPVAPSTRVDRFGTPEI